MRNAVGEGHPTDSGDASSEEPRSFALRPHHAEAGIAKGQERGAGVESNLALEQRSERGFREGEDSVASEAKGQIRRQQNDGGRDAN